MSIQKNELKKQTSQKIQKKIICECGKQVDKIETIDYNSPSKHEGGNKNGTVF